MGQHQQYNPNTSVVGFVEAIKICFNKYADFSGRASLAEYWWFFLFQFLAGCVFGWIPFIGWAINVAVFIPFLAVSWRRMHDIGKGGGWWFINFIPLVGLIIWIIMAVKPSEPQPNRFGPVPGQTI